MCAAEYKAFFHSPEIIRTWVDICDFDAAQSFQGIVESSQAPTIDDWKTTNAETGYSSKHWAIYILTMEKDDEKMYALYCGSATDGERGVRQRFGQYDRQQMLSKWVDDCIHKGWKITHKAPVLRCSIPPLNVRHVCAVVVVILEGVITFLLSALYTIDNKDYGVPDFALWPSQDDRHHRGLCSHSPLRGGGAVPSLDNVLSDEMVQQIVAEKRKKMQEYQEKYNKSDKGKATRKAWNESDKGKASIEKKSKKFRATHNVNNYPSQIAGRKKYAKTEKGRAVARAATRRHRERKRLAAEALKNGNQL